MCTQTYLYMLCVSICIYVYVHVHVSVSYTHTHTHTDIYTYVHTDGHAHLSLSISLSVYPLSPYFSPLARHSSRYSELLAEVKSIVWPDAKSESEVVETLQHPVAACVAA